MNKNLISISIHFQINPFSNFQIQIIQPSPNTTANRDHN